MDDFTRCRAMQAFCRQRAKMEHEDEMFWEAEAEVWAVCTENLIRVDDVMESPKLAE